MFQPIPMSSVLPGTAGWIRTLEYRSTKHLALGIQKDCRSEFDQLLVIGRIVVGLTITLYIVPNMQKAAPAPGSAPQPEFFKQQKNLKTFAMINLILGILVIASAPMLW